VYVVGIIGWIIISCSLGGLISLLLVALGMRWFKASWVPHGVSYSVGAMLSAVFLDLIPHGLEHAPSQEYFLFAMLLGIILLFILEKLFVWRHDHHVHHRAEEAQRCSHTSHQHSTAQRVWIGDSVHNFIDGLLIAASFSASPVLGFNTALAIIAHEIPQGLGDALVLLHAGYSPRKTLSLNAWTHLAMILGGMTGHFFIRHFQFMLVPLLALVSANMLYVTTSDLMPNLHQKRNHKEAFIQGGLMLLGMLTIVLTHHAFEHH
jgi:zinc and cadmium transporter